MKKKLVIYALILITCFAFIFLNRHIIYNEKEKAIYNYVKSKSGNLSANCIILKYHSTDNIDDPIVKDFGEWYDVYGYRGFTGKYEVLYIAVKPDENSVYHITTIKTNP